MKINSIGIDAYRQTAANTQTSKKATLAENESKINQSNKVSIPVQENTITSRLAVKLKSGDFTDMLSTEEKKALEMLFEKFGGSVGSAGYSKTSGVENKALVGNIVDVKL
jgi:hypothetical protein